MEDWGRLRIGDRIRRERRPATFEVVGWTPRGKCRLRNIETGAEVTGWWTTWASLPKGYRLMDELREER